MIVTVTANPSVDRTLFVDALPRGAVVRSRRSRWEPSGKGVNVALALRAHGHAVLAVLPVGGPTGTQIVEMLEERKVPHVAVPIAGTVRCNISLVEPDGTVTKINEAGPALDEDEAMALCRAALAHTAEVEWLACCGSLPAGAGTGIYSVLAAEARRRGVKTAIDTSGAALRAVLDHRPDLVTPNAEELAEATGSRLETLGDVVDAAQALRAGGAGTVLASLGRDGAVLVDDGGALHGEAAVATVVSPVGAGDALLAGFLAAGGAGRGALRQGLAWAAAAVQHEGTLLSLPLSTAASTIHDGIDRRRRLTASPAGRPTDVPSAGTVPAPTSTRPSEGCPGRT